MRSATRVTSLALLGAALSATGPGSGAGATTSDVTQAFDVQVPSPPAAMVVGGTVRLRYELHLTNFARESLTLGVVQAIDAQSGSVMSDLRGDALDRALGRPGLAAGARRALVAPGMRAVVYFDVSRRDAGNLRALRHRIEFFAAAERPVPVALESDEVQLDRRALPVLGPPLRGGPWAAIHDPAMERGHRRVVYAVAGRARIPGRYAIDWMTAGPADGPGPGAGASIPADGLGAEVLAVADAVVIAVRDGVPEPPAGVTRPSVRLGDATGNYVALDLGNGRYAFYEHLTPGLSVKRGDVVRRGQVIARLGSTGQASRPHLHFHVADSNSPLGAEGVPYLLERYRVLGAYDSIAAFNRGDRWRRRTAMPATAAPDFPDPNVVVVFPGREGSR